MRRSPPAVARERGFSLLEVMVALGILVVALLAVGDINSSAVRMHAYAKGLTLGIQLARGKMLDLQYMLRKDGVSDFSKEYHGDFDEEGHPGYTWVAQVVKPELELDPQMVMDQLSSGLGLGGKDDASASAGGASGPTTGAPMLGPMSGLIDGQVKQMVETLKSTVREIKLTVSWKQGTSGEESFDLVEHVVILPSDRAGSSAPAPGAQQLPGMPGNGGAGGIFSPVQAGGIR